jgi:hypothetical protein
MEMARMSTCARVVALLALLLGGLLLSSVGAASASASNGRIGALLNNGELWAKDGDYGAPWTQIATGAKSFSMDGNRIGYLTTAGVAYGKEGNSLTSAWTYIGPPGQKSIAVGAYPPRTMVVNPADDLYVQQGPYATAPGGTYLAGRVGRTAAADGRLAFVNTDSIALRTEEGPLSGANWIFQLYGSTEIALSGHRIVTLLNNGELWAKQGSQDDQWYLLRTGVAHMAASGTRVAAIDTNSKLYVMDKWSISSVTSADWLYEITAATDVALDNDRIGVVLNNGELWIKEGSLSAPWIFEVNGAVKVDLAHRDVTGPTISVSGSLRDATNPLIGGGLNITLDDNAANYTESGAAGYTLSEANGTLLAQQTRAFSGCPFYWCAAVSLQGSATVNPVALNWATGVHHLVLDAWDLVGNHTTTSWDVTYYKTSWIYGGPDHVINTGDEAEHVLTDLPDSNDEYDDIWNTSSLWAGMTTGEQDYVMQVALSYADDSPSGYVPRAGFDLFKLGIVKIRLNQTQANNLRFRVQQVQVGSGACALIGGVVAADAPTVVAKGVALVVTRVCAAVGLTATVIANEISHDLGQSSHPGIVITVGAKVSVSWHNIVPHTRPYFSIDPWN